MTAKAEQKSFTAADETRTFERGALDLLRIGRAEFGARPGDVTARPEGHDAWVVGDAPVVVVDWYGASDYARG